MPRPEKYRTICRPPLMKGFKPTGMLHSKPESLQLTFEQYESIRLISYESMPQKEAADRMNVSRPTVTRIYNKAINIIAKALIEGKAIEIEGGNYVLDNDWYRCRKCYKLIEGLHNHVRCHKCNDFGKNELVNLNR